MMKKSWPSLYNCFRLAGVIGVLAGLILFSSCKKDSFITSSQALLSTSADTLKYDTVFTSTGSVTKSFKIFNNNDQKLRLSKVKLMGGASSAYKMNVDGLATTEASNIEIEANDSIYVFVSLTINPNAANLPFIVSDSILINYNGNDRYIQLQAFGQNANFLRNHVLTGSNTWNKTLPYVILGSLRIDNGATLTIPAGTRIYAHADAPIIVDGTLLVNGTKTDSVVFAGDRLDPDYRDLPAGWPGIYFRENSRNNRLTYAVIKNAYQALVAEKPSPNANPKLIISQCVVDNAYDAGILAVNSSIQADNSLISNCGNNISLSYGGNYSFTHCTVAAYSNLYLLHKNPVLFVSNAAIVNGAPVTSNLDASFRNCIFWGDEGIVTDEAVTYKEAGSTFNVAFQNNLYRNGSDPANSTLSGNIKGIDPSFDSVDVFKRIFNFRITKNILAPGIDKGMVTAFPFDLDNKPRNVNGPDMGCYEKQ
jgi:hypothetical protein